MWKSPIDKPILEALISFHSHPYQTTITLWIANGSFTEVKESTTHITWHQYISIHLNIKHIINTSAQPIEWLQWYGRSALGTQKAWIFWAKLHMPNIMCLQSLLIPKSKLWISRTPILATQPDWCSWLGNFGPKLTISNPNASLTKLRFQTSATFCDQWHSEQ